MITTTNQPSTDEMYQALVAKDRTYDGLFWVGVRTTGIFCRPSCTAKKPNRENVEFFRNAGEALHAGYRPCKRCRPMDLQVKPPEWVCELHDLVNQDPRHRLNGAGLRELGIEPGRARRYFKQHYGMTFAAYQRARRLGQAYSEIRAGLDPTAAAYQSGYESPSGFRDAFAQLFGVPVGKNGSVGCMKARWFESPLGAMLGLATDEGVCLLEFVDRRGIEREIAFLRRRFHAAIVPGTNEHLARLGTELDEYFAGTRTDFSVRIDAPATPFQKAVWDRLLRLTSGSKTPYSELAKEIGNRNGVRAVARAVGDNRIAIVIPCHRVVRSDGHLAGYAGGLWRKQWLLDHEAAMDTAVSTTK